MPSNCLQQETGLQKSFHLMLLPPSQSVNQKNHLGALDVTWW